MSSYLTNGFKGLRERLKEPQTSRDVIQIDITHFVGSVESLSDPLLPTSILFSMIYGKTLCNQVIYGV